MVCRGATQTIFRTWKHQSWIAGRATFIVRVIDCQAEYFRHLLKPVTFVSLLSLYWMGKNSAWSWEHRGLNWTSNLAPPDVGHRSSTNSMVFPMYPNPYSDFVSHESLRNNSAASLPPLNLPVYADVGKRSFMVFDQFGDRTNLVYSSTGNLFPCPSSINPGEDLLWSDENNVSELHEDTEEIDALLYSDSEYNCEEEDVASTGHSPPVDVCGTENGSSSSGVYAPSKRKKRGEDDLLTDTASSAVKPGGGEVMPASAVPDSGSSKRVKRERVQETVGVGGKVVPASAVPDGGASKRVKRERIQETVGVLQQIVPGGRGKDAAAVLDEAIHYLRSLKLKARALGTGATTTTSFHSLAAAGAGSRSI